MVPSNGYVAFIAAWMGLAVFTGIYLLRTEAPYGRFTSRKWGPLISNRWGWFLMEGTVLFTFLAWLPPGRLSWKTPAGPMIALFLAHYIHRSLIYPFMIRTRGKQMPVVIMLSAILFNTVNGSLLGLWFRKWADYSSNWYHSLPFLAGLALFATGALVNLRADYTLISLRRKGETGYFIPRQGLFRFVSSPNLLGEILEWGGYALLTWSLPGLAFFTWTCANLVPRAISNKRWYTRTFQDYPKDRKRLIPFVW